jgi:short-subunit dehydrogenase
MREAGGGTIVNVASILGVRPSPPGLGHYGATKHALLGLFQTVAQEVAEDNIEVIIAAPAGMRTNVSIHSTGPLADPSVDRAADWEDPAIAAAGYFQCAIGSGEVVVYPGYIGRAACRTSKRLPQRQTPQPGPQPEVDLSGSDIRSLYRATFSGIAELWCSAIFHSPPTLRYR